jgi:hypothetical protein
VSHLLPLRDIALSSSFAPSPLGRDRRASEMWERNRLYSSFDLSVKEKNIYIDVGRSQTSENAHILFWPFCRHSIYYFISSIWCINQRSNMQKMHVCSLTHRRHKKRTHVQWHTRHHEIKKWVERDSFRHSSLFLSHKSIWEWRLLICIRRHFVGTHSYTLSLLNYLLKKKILDMKIYTIIYGRMMNGKCVQRAVPKRLCLHAFLFPFYHSNKRKDLR